MYAFYFLVLNKSFPLLPNLSLHMSSYYIYITQKLDACYQFKTLFSRLPTFLSHFLLC